MVFLDRLDGAPPPATYVPKFTPTQEQLDVVAAATQSDDNLLIKAFAGAAKTATLVLVANQPEMTVIPTLCLAFNKKIAEEMKTRLPNNCDSRTLNALGHKVWGQAIGRRLNLDTKKNYNILKELVDAEKNRNIKDDLYDSFSDLLRTFAHGKSSGWVPDALPRRNTRLLDDAEFFSSLDEELKEYEERILIKAMLRSIEASYDGLIDFDDQIFMTACFPCTFPSFPLIMVDETQDLNPLQHRMLDLLVGDSGRLICVGDDCQAIYAFRGAFGDSMERLKHKFRMRELTLSTSFRCPRAVVNEAHWRAPLMTAPEWAEEGQVLSLKEWHIDSLPQDAVIICRNNAPLFKMAITLLIEGRYPQLVGNDIGKTLLKALAKLGPIEMPREEAYVALEDYRLKRLSRARDHAKGSVEDFCLCLRIFLDHGETLGAAHDYANHLMNSVGPVKLMTGHKSKGLEFPNVFILDRQLLRLNEEGAKNQDRNLLYVMQTRAQKVLTYITTEGFIPTEPTGV